MNKTKNNNFLLDKNRKIHDIYLHLYEEFVIDFVLHVAPIMCIVTCHFGFQTMVLHTFFLTVHHTLTEIKL